MKNFLFLCGPNGIGKTTICRNIVKCLSGSAYVDSDYCRMMNPFVLDERTIPTIAKNIAGLIGNYLDCNVVQTVLFSYGFQGRRKEIFDRIMGDLSTHEIRFLPFALTCGKEGNIRRMKIDGRDTDRIERALEISRNAYPDIEYPQIDITELSVDEATALVISRAGLSELPVL
jgi:energy-coupling factor transporter ATP-binding protein EcfA2